MAAAQPLRAVAGRLLDPIRVYATCSHLPQGHRGAGPEYVGQLIALAAIGRLVLRPSISAHIPLAAAAAVAQLERKVGDAGRLVLIP